MSDAPDQQESFISHLIELRDRLLRAVLAIAVVFLVLVPWAADVYDLLAMPMIATLPPRTKMIATGVITPFMVPIKITLLAAFVVALPVVLYQAWAFVAPGLYAHEKKFALPLVFGSTTQTRLLRTSSSRSAPRSGDSSRGNRRLRARSRRSSRRGKRIRPCSPPIRDSWEVSGPRGWKRSLASG